MTKKAKSPKSPKSSSRRRQKNSKVVAKSTATRMPKFPKPEGVNKRKSGVPRDNKQPIEGQHNKILSKAKVSAEWDALYNHSATEKMARGAQQISKITPHARHDNWRVPAKGKNNRHVVKKKK